jgi:uncharacterized repeat protein (TIGR01451 family)
MNQFFQQISERWTTAVNATVTFYRAHRLLLLSGITVVSILLIVWARLGFTFQVSQFFAADQCTVNGGTCEMNSCTSGQEQTSDACDQSDVGVIVCCRAPAPTPVPTPTPTATPPTSGSTTSQHETLSCEGPSLIGPVWPAGGSPTVFRAILQCQADAKGRCDQASTWWSLDWGDNTGETYCGPIHGGCAKDVSHTYAKAGAYTVRLTCASDYVQHTTEVAGLDIATPMSWRPASQTTTITVPASNAVLTPSATPTPTPTPAATPNPTPVPSTPNPTPNPTPTPVTSPSVGALSIVCGASSNVLTWTYDSRATTNSIERGNIGAKNLPNCPADIWCWLPTQTYVHQVPTTSTPATFTDTQLQAGMCYSYRVKYRPDLASNTVSCPVGCAATPTPTPSSSVTPTPTPTATPTTTPTPIVGPGMTMILSGRNATTGSPESSVVQAIGSQQVEVITRVQNTQTTALNNVIVRAALPNGLSYIPGSTSINGVPITVDTITNGGVSVGILQPLQQIPVVFRASVIGTQFVVGSTQVPVGIIVTADSVPANSGTLAVIVNRSAGQIGTVQTGPGDAVVAALLVSAVMTLLYVSYTHTAAFKRKEVDTITRDRDPMDFRS